ncbi:hypothetical protein Cni_G24072 [Canna indica]|uniref:Transmembrane protein 194 n=1 Tax=Canna indica TaxID=4628 RepID=A0AAQ3QJR3_9LILI|nr:hypothetical protein Cni_G24072 [Canna indica]
MKICVASPSSLLLLLLLLSLFSLFIIPVLTSSERTPLLDVNLENPILKFGASSCQRVHVSGTSRLNLKLYASAVRVVLNVSEAKPDSLLGNIEVCFHRNSSIGLCQCEDERWESLQKSQWSLVLSPYESRYIDVKVDDKISRSLTITLKEDFQQWRLVCLGLGFLLLLIAPIISSWVPFYYSSSMALGVLLVVLIILFQGMKLLPTGRKTFLYLIIYGSVLGVGSFIAHYFSTMVNSLLVSFGLNEELHNPVSVFLVVGIVIAGAALGYWIVRKFVLSEDGRVDVGIAKFVKWAMRFIGVVFILQSTLDVPLALAALAVVWNFCSLVNSFKWRRASSQWQITARRASSNRQAEFFSPTSKKEMGRTLRGSSSPHPLSLSPIRAAKSHSAPYKRATQRNKEYYSTYHKMPSRKFSKKEWDDFTRESTSSALKEWASSSDVAKWIAENAHRMSLDKGSSSSSEETMESSSVSSEETEVEDSTGRGFFKWL